MSNLNLKVKTNIRGTQIINTINDVNLPARIVDLEKNEIIKCDDWEFWTLSYVWKTLKEEEIWNIGKRPYPANKIDWKVTAFTENEWKETRKILIQNNIKKVWVDALCIDQLSILEKQQEISKMADIYKTSLGCIIFANGLNNICKLKDFKERKNKWFTRVWTVQEGILPKKLSAHFKFDKDDENNELIDVKEIINNLFQDENNIKRELGMKNIAPYELLRIISKRNATKSEDKIYCLLGILGLKNVELNYSIGERNAAINLFQAMPIDQRVQWICVDWISGVFPDGMSCIPMLKSNYHGHNIDITSNITIRTTMAFADFQGHNGTWITGKWFESIVSSNFNSNEDIKEIKPKDIILKENNYVKKCFGVCEYSGKIIVIILGTTEELNQGEKVLLICNNIGSVLQKKGLAISKINDDNIPQGKWLVV